MRQGHGYRRCQDQYPGHDNRSEIENIFGKDLIENPSIFVEILIGWFGFYLPLVGGWVGNRERES